MKKYVYCIYEECHGLIGIWDDETLARKEVDRLSENYEDIEQNGFFWNSNRYGNDMVCYERVKLNVPW